MKNLKPVLLFFFVAFSFALQAQDYMYKKNGEIVKVKVVEIGTDEIKYYPEGSEDGPIYAIEKDMIQKLEMANGDVLELSKKGQSTTGDSKMNNEAYYTNQHRSNIKISFTSLLNTHLDLYYEHAISASQSFEAGIAIIGVGFTPDGSDFDYYSRNSTGFGINLGYKLKRSPSFYIPKMRYGHILKGGYLKPNLILNFYSEDQWGYDHITGDYYADRQNATAGAFMLNIGKQWVFDDRVSLDFYFGIGYGFTNSVNKNEYLSQYGFITFGDVLPIAFTSGISIGYVFDWKKK